MRCVEGCLQCVRIHDPADETCDDVDNDCNCDVDDGYPQAMGDPPPRFAARLIDLSYASVVSPGQMETVWAQFENAGTEPWLPREVMLAPAVTREGEPSRLDPESLWPAWDVADVVETAVEPGDTALLSFPVTVPADASGAIEESFVLLGSDGRPMKCPMPDLALSMMVGDNDGKGDEGSGSGRGELQGLASGCACSMEAQGRDEAAGVRLMVLLAILALLWLPGPARGARRPLSDEDDDQDRHPGTGEGAHG